MSGGIFGDCSARLRRHPLGDRQRRGGGLRNGQQQGRRLFADAADVDTASALLTLDDGTLAVVSNTRYNARGHDVRLELHGSKDSIAVGLEDRLPLRSVEPGASFPAGKPHYFFMDRFVAAFRAELAAFTQVVAGQRPSPARSLML